jgi:hypothetical protein
LQWKKRCVAFAVDARGIPPLDLDHAETESLVSSSFALWPATECTDGFPSISVQSAGKLECGRAEYNSEGPNANSVIFRAASWPHDPAAIGVTTVTFDPESGRIVDADIEVNLTGPGLGFFDVQYVLTHEAGHFFGIDHSVDRSAVMFAQTTSSNFTAPPVLGPDDEEAICLAYPALRSVGACDFEPEKGYSPVCGGDLDASCALRGRARAARGLTETLFVLMAFGVLARRRKTATRREA